MLSEIYKKYHDKGLQIVAYPCNQFGEQERGTPQEIKEFVSEYDVTFPIMKKCDVNGENADPAFAFLREKSSLHGDYILWNFTKFMVNKYGQVLSYYKFDTSPEQLIPEIEILCEVDQTLNKFEKFF